MPRKNEVKGYLCDPLSSGMIISIPMALHMATSPYQYMSYWILISHAFRELTVHLQQLVITFAMECKQPLMKNIFGSTIFILKPQDILCYQDCLWAFLYRISRTIAGRLREAEVPLNPHVWWANDDGVSTFCQKCFWTKPLGERQN